MTTSLKYPFYKTMKNLAWILSFLLYSLTQILFLPTFSFACSLAFQEITPQQLKDRLLSISENKKEDIQNMNIESCGPACLSFYSKTGIQFQIKKDLSISEPEIVTSSSSKTLKIPYVMDLLNDNNPLNNSYLRHWLVGHEIYSYNQHLKKNIQHIETQNITLKKQDTSRFFETKEEAHEVIRRKKINSIKNFIEQRKNDPELQKIPINPPQRYKNWSWKEVFGKPKFFESKEEAYEVIQRKNVKSTNFRERRKDDPEIQKIPINPWQRYKDWSWKEAFGKPKFFETKEEAYEVIRRKNINSRKNFAEQRKNNPELQKIPINPLQRYKNWSWKEAFGKPKFFETKEEAYEVIQRKKINSRKNFTEQRKNDPELQKIPARPQQRYKNWSWKEAFGKPKFFKTKEEAYEVIQRKKINSRKNFTEQRKNDPELQKIPARPRRRYKNWSWKEAFGKPKFFESKEEAYEVIQRKNVKSTNFRERRKDDPEIQKIPTRPQERYKNWNWKEATEKTNRRKK